MAMWQNPIQRPAHPRRGIRACCLVTLTLLALGQFGCLTVNSYLDTQYRKATFSSLKVSGKVTPVDLQASFQVNGINKPAVDGKLRQATEKTLIKSRLVSIAPSGPQVAQLKIILNNIADTSEAKGKGFATGLTFGAVGSEVVDFYEMTVVYTPPGGALFSGTYKHALHTTVGSHEPPQGMEPVPKELATDQLIEDMVLNCLRDLQNKGFL